MLTKLPQKTLPSSLEQKLIVDPEKISRRCGNAVRESWARNRNNVCELVLYRRKNFPRLMCEAGILYLPGPKFQGFEKFPAEMLRFFSRDPETCFDLAQKYYLDLVEEKKFICKN